MPKDKPSVGRYRFRYSVFSTLYRRARTRGLFAVFTALLTGLVIGASLGSPWVVKAQTPNSTINYQARILSASGALVPDGNYHVEFKIYNAALPDGGETPDQGACTVNTGTADEDCLWVETRTTGNLVRVVNGYVSVNLGSVTAFPTNMPWGSQLYVTMRIGGMSGPSWDTEMTNATTGRMRITAVPYAFQAANVRSGDTNAASTNSNNIVVQTGNATGATSNSGSITIDSGTATGVTGALLLGTTNASAITLGHSGITTTIQGSVSLTGTGTALTVTNNVQVDGNTTLGNNAGVDTLTVNAAANFTGNLSVSSGNTFTNAGSTVFTAITAGPFGADGSIGSAASTVDVATTINLSASTTGVDLTLASPTSTTAGRILYLNNTGANSLTVEGNPIASGKSSSFIWNGTAWVQTISFTSTGVDTVGGIDGGSYSANGASIAGTTIYLQTASATQVGLVNLSAQTFAGVKTFNSGIVLSANQSLTVTGGNTASRPASPTEGMVYFDTTTKQLLTYANGKWQADRTDAVLVAASNSSQADKDIADFVADGNTGSANDGDQVQINSALTAGSGKKVVLLAGTYVADATILIPNNTTFQGVGNGTVIELADIDSTDNLIENSDTTTGTGVIIRDMKLDGRSDLNTVGNQRGIRINNIGSSTTAGFEISNLVIQNFRQAGIYADYSENNKLNGTIIENSGIGPNGWGAYFEAVSYTSVTSNIFRSNNQGFDWHEGSAQNYSNTFANNIIEANTGYNFFMYGNNHSTVTGNTVVGNGANTGIELYGNNNTVTGNSVSNVGTGFWLTDGTNNIITNNSVSTTPGSAIFLGSNFNYNTIANNNISNSGDATLNDGIYLFNADNNSIIGNSITDTSCTTTCYAINIGNAGSDNNYLSNNTYSTSSGTATINDAGTGTRYASQTIAQNGLDILFKQANSTTAFAVQNATGNSILNVDTTNGEVELGNATTAGKLVVSDGSSNTVTILANATAGDFTATIPTLSANDTFCMATLGNCTGGANIFTDGGTFSYLTTTTDQLVVGANTAQSAKLAVVGTANETQLLIKANATQSLSNPLVLLQNSSGAELARINASTSSLYFGNAAGGSSAAGANNTGIGASALGSVSTGTGNTTLGSGALASVSVGTNNTALGYNAGNLSTGSSNLFLGQGAGSNATTGSNNIIIGAGLNASAAGVSNELRIGGILQGDTSTLAAQFNGTLAVTTLGTADTSTFLCRNTFNQLATCSSTPLTSSLTDNITNAFDLQESTNNYININTTNGSENVSFGNASTNPSYNFLGSGTLAVAGSQTIGGTLAVTGNSTLGGDLAVNGGDITTAAGDLTIAPAGNDTLITGNLDVSGTLFAGTGDAFQVSSTGAVTAVGVNSGTGLIQGTGGLTILGTTSINATGSSNTSIGATSNSGTIAIGNSASTTNILGATTINTTGTAATSIGNSGAVTTLSGSSILLNSATLQRTSAGTTSFDLVDGANTTLALQNSGAGVLNLTVDGSATVGTNLTVSGGTATLGTAAQAGSLVVSDGSSSTITIKSATQVAATNYDVTVPAITANDTFCLFTLNNCVNANAFVQNGNSFTGAATLGTNDAYTLAFETNNITRITLDTSYKAYFGNGATNATPQGFTLQGTSGSGTNITGAGLTIASGQGTGTGTSGNITFQYAPAGASGSSLNALQAACTISGTNGSLSCPGAGSDSERFGAGATAGGSQAVALGYIAQAGGVNSIAIGGQSIANVYQSNAIGWGATSPGTNSLAVGTNATSNTDSSVALGVTATSGQNGVSLGYGSVSGFNSTALGQQASANNYASIALGSRATTTADYQLVVGSENDGAYVLNGYLGAGITSANAASRDFKLQVTSGSGTNIGGADFTLAGGQGTGTGVGGALLFQTAKAGTSGSSLNSLQTVLSLSGTNGSALFQNSINSATGFQVQNATGSSILNVNTLSSGYNLVRNPSFEGNINGWSNKGTGTVSLGTDSTLANFGRQSLQIVTGTSTNNGGVYAYQFKPSTQYSLSFYARRSATSAAAFNIGRTDNGSDTDCLTNQTLTTTYTQFSCTFTTGATINASAGFYIKQTDTATDTIYLDGVTLVEGATALAYTVDASALQVDSANAGTLTLLNSNSGEPGPWQRTTAIGSNKEHAKAVYANGYVYQIGGWNGGSVQTSAYYAKVNADGTIGTWNTTTSLPAARYGAAITINNGYVYVIGGRDTISTANSTVYYARLNADGTIGTWRTNPTALTNIRYGASAISANGYIYVIGGIDNGGTASNTTYYGRAAADGSIASWTAGATLPANRYLGSAELANGYIYYMGGNTGAADAATVYSSLLNASTGAPGSWTDLTATPLPAARNSGSSAVSNGYIYYIGGNSVSTSQTNVYYARLNAAGTVSAWQTATNLLPDSRAAQSSIAINGYIYAFGGYNATLDLDTVLYSRIGSNLQVGANIDLVGIQGGTLGDGSQGGSITAGNGIFVGTLQVQQAANFSSSLNVVGDLTSGNHAVVGDISLVQGSNRTISVSTRTDSGTGYNLTIQGGGAGSGNNNGGNLNLSGGASSGTGVKGLVVIDTATYSTATVQNFTANANITQANIDSFGAVSISGNVAGWVATLTDPTLGASAAGRVIYVSNTGSVDITLAANTVGVALSITLKPASTATMYWNGTDWTAAGASSSTDLQAAYNNTATSAGGAELVLNAAGGAADGLTVRNNATTPIIGGLLEVQTAIGSNLFTVNNNATEYATNGGAETAGGSSSTFPSNTWDTTTGGTVDRWTTTGDNVATGQASVRVQATTTNHGARNRLSTTLTSGLTYTVSFAVRGATNFSTLQILYSPDGTTTGTTQCATAQTVTTGQWTRITCSFIASGTITSSNSILIRQTDGVAHTFYIDNLSVNVNASANHAADGSVDNSGAFATNWTNYQPSGTATASYESNTIYDTAGSAQVDTSATAGIGLRNNMAITPQVNTQYLVSFYAYSTTTMTSSLAVGFLPAGGTGAPSGSAACTDYSTQSLTASTWTKITCLFTTPGSGISNPDLVVYQTDASARTIYVDALSITLNTNNSNNVQIGGGNKGGPATLFTLDRSAGAPIAANNDAYLGSMYYDTTTGRIQCYEADGWGACGAAPDNIVNLNPEYAGAVLNGSGVGTMTADFCSDDTALTVNASLCETGQAKNYYRWTSPQATSQTYSIYVTYQLPATFADFSSDDTVQLTARVDNTSNAEVTYQMFRSTGSAVTQCGTSETDVIAGGGDTANVWHTYGINGNEATGSGGCAFAANDFIIFKINMKANSNANAYVSTLSFVTTGR